MFQGVRDYHPSDPQRLLPELQRQNSAIESAFGDAERSRLRWSVVRTSASLSGSHRQAILVDAAENIVVRLPVSSSSTAGLCVRIVRRSGSGIITVVAVAGQKVNNAASIQMAAAIGKTVELLDDGIGGFWGST